MIKSGFSVFQINFSIVGPTTFDIIFQRKSIFGYHSFYLIKVKPTNPWWQCFHLELFEFQLSNTLSIMSIALKSRSTGILDNISNVRLLAIFFGRFHILNWLLYSKVPHICAPHPTVFFIILKKILVKNLHPTVFFIIFRGYIYAVLCCSP